MLITAEAYLNKDNVYVMTAWLLNIVLVLCFMAAMTVDVENKTLFMRVFRPFRREVLTIIPISRSSTPASSV